MPNLADYLLANRAGGNFGTMSPGEEAAAVTPGSVLDALANSAYRLGATPRDAMRTPVQPTNGMVSDEDVARAQLGERDVGRRTADLATALIGAGAPAAETGAAGIFGGKLAKTADQVMLTKAQELASAGAARDEIWKQTGWFRGPDQKWRFEIPDNEAVFRSARMPTAGETQYDPAVQFLAHEKAFTAYPELQDIDTSVSQNWLASGRYFPPQDRGPKLFPQSEEIQVRGETPLQAKSVLLHELQHAIQDREGFTKGANTADFTYGNSPLFQYRKSYETPMEAYHRVAGEVEARNVQRRMFMTPEKRAANPPWETEDYTPGQQILNMDYSGAQAKR